MSSTDERGGQENASAANIIAPQRVSWGVMGIGLLLVVIPLFMAVLFRDAYGDTQKFLRIIISLGGGLIGSQIPGLIRLNFPGVEAIGGISVFALILMLDPLWKAEGASEKSEISAQNAAAAQPPVAKVSTNVQNTSLSQCLSTKRQAYEQPKEKEVVGGARVGGPGLSGGKRKASEKVCVSVGPGQKLISANTQEMVCHGGRCSVTAPLINNNTVCVTAQAWSESNSFGGGGSGQYKLVATYIDVAGETQMIDFEAACRSELG
jgi:hypothetical protein